MDPKLSSAISFFCLQGLKKAILRGDARLRREVIIKRDQIFPTKSLSKMTQHKSLFAWSCSPKPQENRDRGKHLPLTATDSISPQSRPPQSAMGFPHR